MIALTRNILSFLDIVNPFQNRQPMPDAGNAHALQIIMLQSNESLANNFVFYRNLRIRSVEWES